jgi:hypothetical protein
MVIGSRGLIGYPMQEQSLDGPGNVLHVIDLQQLWAVCCICGVDTPSRWGVPIGEDGLIVANDYEGEWAAKPACEKCWGQHEHGEYVGHDPAYCG